MTTLPSTRMTLPSLQARDCCTASSCSMLEEESVLSLASGRIFVLSDEASVEAVQTCSFPKAVPQPSLIERYAKYNSYVDRKQGPNFDHRANAFVRLFQQHTRMAPDPTMDQLLLDGLVNQFSECWRHTQTDLLGTSSYSSLPADQVQFAILVNRKRFSVIRNQCLQQDTTEQTTTDDRQLELLRVLHGYYYRHPAGLETAALVDHAIRVATESCRGDPRVIDLVLHTLILALPVPNDDTTDDCCFPCDLKLKAIAFAVWVLAGPQTTVFMDVTTAIPLRRNACRLLYQTTTLEGATRRAFEELDVVTGLCTLIRNLEKDTVFYREATVTLKAILALPE